MSVEAIESTADRRDPWRRWVARVTMSGREGSTGVAFEGRNGWRRRAQPAFEAATADPWCVDRRGQRGGYENGTRRR